ncbi:MAG: AMP-binding protein [Rhodospirillales bacterium]|nr:AMP-binding protein [Rhodospirillales bacterium]
MTFDDDGFIHIFSQTARADSSRIFAVFDGKPITFGELSQMSDSFAAGLRRLGVARGDRVAVMLRNSAAGLATLFGLAKSGTVWVPINAQQRGEGLRFILEHAAPIVLVVENEFLTTIRESGTDTTKIMIIALGEGCAAPELGNLLMAEMSYEEPPPRANDHFAIMYTSGTTGRPKGVLVTHRMMRIAGEGVSLVAEARAGDTFFVWEPLYHIGGAQLIVLPLIRNVRLAFVERFSASRFWQQAKDSSATHIHYLGGILPILLKRPPTPLDRTHGVRIAWGGGCPKDLWQRFEERFGVRIRECYGMTEASSITTYNDAGIIGSVGRPVPWFSIELVGADGRPVKRGDRGEIIVRTNRPGAIFEGYFRDREATARTLKGGALHTGDSGSFNGADALVFHGRMTDSVRCKGENVSAWEVERVAAGHPDIEDCAMIGVIADVGEQDIKLFVKAKAGADIDPPGLSAWLGERLAPYQNPRYIKIIEEFERTPSQRIIKRRLSSRLDDCWDRLGETAVRRMPSNDLTASGPES